MKKIIPFLMLTLLWSCSNNDPAAEVIRLENVHAETPTTEVKKELLASYENYLPELDVDDNAYSAYALKKATLEMDLNNYQAAAATATEAIQNHASGIATSDNILLLSNVTVNHIYKDDMNAAVDAFKKLFPDPAAAKSTLQPILKRLGTTMIDAKTGQQDRKQIREFISLSKVYAGILPQDEEAQKSLFTAANMSIAIKNYDDALSIYDYVLAHPSDFSKVSTALFLKGFTYDEHLKNFEEARKYYTEFLEKYPEDTYAASVKASLDNLGKSEEDIIKSFEK